MFNQENIILSCSSCQAKYNVTKLQAGTKFKCSKCGTINVVQVREDAPTDVITSIEAPQATKRPTSVMRQPPTKKPSTVTRQSALTRPSALKRGVTAGKFTRQQGTEPSEDGDKKKKNKTWMIVGIIGGVVLLIIIIIALSSGGESEEQKMLEEANKKAAEKESDKFSETDKETPKETEETEKTPEPEPKKVEEKKPPKEIKSSKSKLEIDETVKTEVAPLVKDMRNQKDDEQKTTIEKITAQKKKAIPVLIEIIGGEDEWASMYAYEILIKITKRNRDDTQKVTQMLSRDMRRDCQKDWEEWWLKNKDSIPD